MTMISLLLIHLFISPPASDILQKTPSSPPIEEIIPAQPKESFEREESTSLPVTEESSLKAEPSSLPMTQDSQIVNEVSIEQVSFGQQSLEAIPEKHGAWEDYLRTVAFEINVLWPFFPGGIVDFKFVIPAVLPARGNWRGEMILGLNSDFGWRGIRPLEEIGRVAVLSAKVGYRQFLVSGLHLDATLNAGWRHEEISPLDGEPLHSFQGRLWVFAGYQHEFTRHVYANFRGGGGVHVFRTDRFADQEKVFVPAGDLNIGIRF